MASMAFNPAQVSETLGGECTSIFVYEENYGATLQLIMKTPEGARRLQKALAEILEEERLEAMVSEAIKTVDKKALLARIEAEDAA